MAKTKSNKKKSQTRNNARGTQLAALGASAAALGGAAYYFLGPKGKQHQRDAKRWALAAEKKIAAGAKTGKRISDSLYEIIMQTDWQLNSSPALRRAARTPRRR